MSKPQPLVNRLYSDPALHELARIVGYAGKSVPDVHKESERFVQLFGRGRMGEAAAELIDVDVNAKPPFARLRPSVVPMCFQLLGSVPAKAEEFYRNADGTENWPAWKEWPKAAEPPKPKRSRKKAS